MTEQKPSQEVEKPCLMNFNLEAMRSFITTTQLCHGSTKTYNMLMTKDGCVSRKFNLQRQVGLDLVSSLANMSLLVQNLSLVIQSFFFLSGHNSYHVVHILSANANHRAMFLGARKI